MRHGLGPLYIRSSCIHCHPGYGHGKSQNSGTFNTNEIGNGYLLVVYNPETEAYVPWLAGMPQTHAVAPFKAPLDESQITITWHEYTDAFGNKFPDGETYQLRYPEVDIPRSAIYVANRGYDVGEYEVRLESTIGIYGTGLLDAISDEDLKAEYAKQEQDGYLPNGLNPNIFANGDWTGQYEVSLPLYLRPEPWPLAGRGGCQCLLEHHQRHAQRPPLPLPRRGRLLRPICFAGP